MPSLTFLSWMLFFAMPSVFGGETPAPVPPTDAQRRCERDRDCDFARLSCCGPLTPIATSKKAEWESKLVCSDVMCLAVEDPLRSTHLPGCERGLCIAKPIPDFSKSSAADCERLDRSDAKSICLQTVALSRENFALCRRIPEAHRQHSIGDCLIGVLSLKRARGKLEKAHCGLVRESQPPLGERCLHDLALQSGDPRVCLDLSDSQKMQSCLTETMPLAKQAEHCLPLAKLPDLGLSYASSCLETVAARENDPSTCDRIVGLAPEDLTFGSWFSCIVKVAKAGNRPEICKKVVERKRPAHYSTSAFDEKDCRRRLRL
ncbi:MAG: hypothetical protein NDJ89_13540 [Oligoflexia bacterium]|nr:hypothetical protein [Oligoflexia bacterium]